MGRLPCDMGGENKKSQWTPEEDLKLVSYIQEKGTNNWSSLPNDIGLKRCSKSCRLRWFNHLRPGLNRGNFTAEEDRKIINLQALLGNKWSAIAHYLPERTDNDVKNYWNTHLKKEIANSARGSCNDDGQRHAGSGSSTSRIVPDQNSDSSERSWERRLHVNVHAAKKALLDALSPPASAAHPAATLPPTAPGLSSSLAMATAPLPSSGCKSFKPPRGWNQSASQQQLMKPADDHQLRSQAASQNTLASTYSSTTEPYVFNCENVALWLQRWNKEIPMDKNSARHPSLHPQGPPAVLGRQEEDFPHPAVVATSSSSSGRKKRTAFRN